MALLGAGAEANAANNSGWTPLMFAASGGHLGTLKLLLEEGAAVNAKNKYGVTALMATAQVRVESKTI
eukprot:2838829-Pyramimonas_sp.AAC.1